MSKILYYSNFCENSGKILNKISKSNIKSQIHFICIDKRFQQNGKTYLILENNDKIILPNTITAVPALLLLNEDFKIIFGNSILDYLNPIEEVNEKISTNFNGEPNAFALSNTVSDINSDNYSFLNQDSNELSAKGDGGLRQLYNYSTLQNDERIITPPEDYVPDKINEESYKQYEDQRKI
tara:strand:- start:183 stop:725 length:543 start_codon:yes stop_codon:yes gene_type:complete